MLKIALTVLSLLISLEAQPCGMPQAPYFQPDPLVKSYFSTGKSYIRNQGYQSLEHYVKTRFPSRTIFSSYFAKIVTTEYPIDDVFFTVVVKAIDTDIWDKLDKVEVIFVVGNNYNSKVFPYVAGGYTLGDYKVQRLVSRYKIYSPRATIYVIGYSHSSTEKDMIYIASAPYDVKRQPHCMGAKYEPNRKMATRSNKSTCDSWLKFGEKAIDVPACELYAKYANDLKMEIQ